MTKPTVKETRRIICRNEVAATIERCAQVAESFHAYDRPASEIAAAIRALKNE